MLGSHDRAQVRAIADELATIRLDAPVLAEAMLPAIRALTELECVLLYAIGSRSGSWALQRFGAAGDVGDAEVRMRRLLARASEPPVYYNPLMPPRAQRNRVIDAVTWIEAHAPATWERSPLFVEVLRPTKLHRHRQPRALICDGPELLAWFGALHSRRATTRQTRLLSALIAPMRERLIAERRLLDAPLARAALDVMLERLGAPAFVIDSRGGLHEANAAGRALVDVRGADVGAALCDALAGRPNELAFELVDVRASGLPSYRVAILRVDTVDARIAACVGACAQRWQLTPRQTEVLALVTRGATNAAIGAALGCVERTVELHVTALLDRAGVDSRAALVSLVLTA